MPPDIKSVDPTLVAVAKFMLGHKELKQREGILNEKRYKFFKGTYFPSLFGFLFVILHLTLFFIKHS